MVVDIHPITKRSVQRSWTVRGDETTATATQADLVSQFGLRRVPRRTDGARLTVSELIERLLPAPRVWRPATYRSYGSPARFLARDPLGEVRLGRITPARVDVAIARLRRDTTRRNGRDATELAHVFLDEGDVDTAWAEAMRAGVTSRLWLQLAAAREADHPLDVIPVYKQEVERAISAKNNDGYRNAVERLDHIAKLMGAARQPEAFAPYAAEVRARHKPKRNLMKLLDQRGW